MSTLRGWQFAEKIKNITSSSFKQKFTRHLVLLVIGITVMNLIWCYFYILLSNSVQTTPTESRYKPTWDSLDTRPIPTWFDDAKIGIFIHWGVFSVPSSGEWFWSHWKSEKGGGYVKKFMQENYPPGFSYQEFAKEFTAEFFNPDEWAEIFKLSGAKYVVLTSKHHEGYTLWPSTYSYSWNSQDVGPHRDLVGDLAKAVRRQGLTFGLYYSLYEWFNPLYLQDKNNSFETQYYVDKKMLPEIYELINNYKPAVIWSDGDWEANYEYFKTTEFLAWLYNDSPVKDVVLVNDRWGNGYCKHGDFYSCQDRFNPGVLQTHKWENAMSIDRHSWGYRRHANIYSYLTIEELIETLAQTISCGGNILINVGPTKEGTISPIFQERLLFLGKWLSINGEAIYKSKPWIAQNDTSTSGVWYTTNSDKNVYAIVLRWPDKNTLELKSVVKIFSDSTTVNLLGNTEKLKWSLNKDSVSISFPDKASVSSPWAWVLRIINK